MNCNVYGIEMMDQERPCMTDSDKGEIEICGGNNEDEDEGEDGSEHTKSKSLRTTDIEGLTKKSYSSY